MDPIGVGIIGAGARIQGLCRLLEWHQAPVSFVAVCDPDPGAVTSARSVLGADMTIYEDYRDLAQDPRVDWVLVGSWNAYHRPHAVAALDAGKHVFCEKPLAITLEDCIAIRDAWRASGRKFAIGFTLRYSPHYLKIKELLDAGTVGKVISLEFNETLDFNHGGFIHSDWRRLRKYAGTHLLEKCCHDLDLVNWLLETRPARVASFGGLDFFTPDHAHLAARIGTDAHGRRAYRTWSQLYRVSNALVGDLDPFTADKDIVDNQVAIIAYQSGVRATFHTNCNSALPERRMHILGTEGTIRADVIAGTIEVARIGFVENRMTLETGASGGHGGGDMRLVQELVRYMTEDVQPNPGLEDALAAAVSAFGIDEAMERGQVVDMQPYWDEVDGPDAST